MPKISVHNFEGKVVGSRELPAAIFGLPVKPELLQFAVVTQQANSRHALAHTKTRGEVRGGGRKPWRQKGTGRARHGSIRSPIWIGGGITFGPRSNRNFSLKINQKVRRKALFTSLSAKVVDEALVVVDDISPVGKKSKQAAQLMKNLKLRFGGKAAVPAAPDQSEKSAQSTEQPKLQAWPSVLVVLPPKSEEQVLAFRNLRRVSVIAADSLNVVDVLKHKYLVLPVPSLELLSKVYGPKAA